jgi:GMC oxidoreductase
VNRKFANLTGLRILDCSIVPTFLGGNTNAPAIMIGENSAKAGWRSSADGPLLCPFSLLTGNFTGNFAKSRLLARQRL